MGIGNNFSHLGLSVCLSLVQGEGQTKGGSRILCRRGRQSFEDGPKQTILPKFPKKLHEIEKILGRGGVPGECAGLPPLDPLLQMSYHI